MIFQRKKIWFRCFFLACSFSLVACQEFGKTKGDFEIIDDLNVNSTIPYDFARTLADLYPQSTDIVLATVIKTDEDSVEFTVDKNYYGTMTVKNTYVAQTTTLSTDSLLTDSPYLFFVDHEDAAQTQLLTDTAGWLRIQSDSIFPSGQSNISSSFPQAERMLSRLEEEVFLPPRFYYYRNLEELVASSDYIFVGKVSETENIESMKFFFRSTGVEENFTDSGMLITFKPTKIIKGSDRIEKGEPFRVLLSSIMLQNTIESNSLKPIPVAYTDDTIQELTTLFNKNSSDYIENYLVFANLASQRKEFSAYFVNPVQGVVPITKGPRGANVTLPVSFNAPFVQSMDESEVLSSIQDILDGEYTSARYDDIS